MEPLGVLINSFPLLGKKAGIGHYVDNLCRELARDPELALIYSHRLRAENRFLGIGMEDLDALLRAVSGPVKRMLGSRYPTASAATTYNLLFYPLVALSRRRIKNLLREKKLHLYHETRHTIIPELEEFLGEIKLIADIHDLSPVSHPEWHLREHVREVARSLPRLLAADHIITKSAFVREDLIDRFQVEPARVTAIPNAPGGAYHRLTGPARDRAEKKARALSDDRPFLLYTGTIEPRKNLATLLAAFRIIKERYDGLLLLAGGHGWLYQEILKAADRPGLRDRVRFLGYTTEETLLALYNHCDLFVYPSWYEGFGMPPLEAMCCGAVPVVSNSSSLPEVVEDGGVLFDPHSPEELAEKVLNLLADQERLAALRQRGLALSSRYQWPTIARQVARLYKEVCAA